MDYAKKNLCFLDIRLFLSTEWDLITRNFSPKNESEDLS